ncbi:MAG: FGGY-family carbohydrate kinase [Acidimicrobiia bacterium]|nr:FGGY-family carbohydrate kinase [Acidimicrobiia bacterium]
MANRHALAIDLGTTGPKVALVSDDGTLLGEEAEPVDLILLPNGGAEQDPHAWWQAIAAATRRCLTANPGIEVAAISVTSQWSGTVAVDEAGEPIGRAIIWMDTRGARHIRQLIRGPVRFEGYDILKARKWIAMTGGAPTKAGKDPVGHIAYLREEQSETYQRTRVFLEPKDFINFRLTGQIAASYDSIAMHWATDNRDPHNIDYDAELLAYCGIERHRLPDLLPATAVMGTVSAAAANSLGIAAGTPVLAGTPDVHSAAMGSGTTTDFKGSLYVGTSSWVTCHVPFKKTDLPHNIASLPAAVPGRYLVLNEQETAGKALEWVAGLLCPDHPAPLDRLNELAAAADPGSGGVIFTPWLFGERSPVEDATLRGGFFNQSLETGPAELARSVFEGVAYNTRWLLGHVEKLAGARLDPIVLAGGGARSPIWGQIFADVLERTIRVAADPVMVNVRGAGLLAHAALGHVSWDQIPSLVPMTATVRPNRDNQHGYARLYDAFRRIHKSSRRIYRRLNG